MNETLYLVIPCYNEEDALPLTAQRLANKLNALIDSGEISSTSKVLFVNDGSHDNTWAIIRELHQRDNRFSGVDLSRNRGHQNALFAGLMIAKDRCDVAISLDADLQDDVDAIDAMLDAHFKGAEIVYGVRSLRKKDTWFKRTTARAFYRIINALGAETIPDHADFRLMSSRALNALAQFGEVNLFLRGIVPMIGYQTSIVTYERCERVAGESKYPLKKMLSFALEGITSLSVKPLHMVTAIGFIVFPASIIMLAYSVIQWATGASILGWASLICSIWAIGGLILLALGIIGEYIGKIYMETKARPRYFIQEILEDNLK